jgi:hypothetical protein
LSRQDVPLAGPLHGSRAGRSLHGQQGGEPGHEPIELDEDVRTSRASSGRQHCDHHWIYRDSIDLHWYGILVILEGSGFLHGWGLRSESMIGTCMCSGVREFDWIGWRLGFRGPTSGQCSLWAVAVFRGRSIDAGLRLEGDLALFPCTLHCC